MKEFQVTKLSSKGQVVLPQAIRDRLHLIVGEKFVVVGSHDTVILKKIEMPSLQRAKRLVRASQAYAKRVGLKPADVKRAIQHVRSKS